MPTRTRTNALNWNNFERFLSAHHMITLGAALFGDTMLNYNSFSQGSHWVREEQSVCSSHGMSRCFLQSTSLSLLIKSNLHADQIYSRCHLYGHRDTLIASWHHLFQYIIISAVHFKETSICSVQKVCFYQ